MTRPLRAMQIITRLVRGGAQRIALDLADRLRPDGFETVLVAGEETGEEGSLWREAEESGIETVPVAPLVRDISPIRDWRALGALRRVVREHRPDIVHAHTSKAGLLGCLAARKEGVAVILLAPHGHILGEEAEIPGVPRRGWKRRLLATLARRSARYADIVVAPNEDERQDGIRLGLWREDRSVVVPNGIDAERFSPAGRAEARRELGWREDETLVGCVARLSREKGVDLAIDALAGMEGVHLVVVGKGPDLEPLRERGRELGVAERIRFLGERADVDRILPALDVVVVPSRTEAHGLVAAEAMACGVPVVAASVGGLRSLVIDGETGLRVQPGEAGGIARALQRVLGDRPLGKALAEAGRRHIVDHFSTGSMIEATVRLYRRLWDSRSDRR